MASAADAESSAFDDVPRRWGDAAEDSVRPRLARTCHCADADVKAYREGADWICHTRGHKLSERAVGLLAGVARPRERPPDARDATHMQPPVS